MTIYVVKKKDKNEARLMFKVEKDAIIVRDDLNRGSDEEVYEVEPREVL